MFRARPTDDAPGAWLRKAIAAQRDTESFDERCRAWVDRGDEATQCARTAVNGSAFCWQHLDVDY